MFFIKRALPLFFASLCAAAADRPALVHSYIGPEKRIEFLPLATGAPSQTASVYAGGPYNVSIAKTTVDAAGNLYAIGSQFVTVGSYHAHSVFVTKIDPAGATVYITRLGGKGDDIALGIGVDSSGRVVGGGYTTSPDFPLVHAIQTDDSTVGTTGFVFSLDPSGNLLWSTYFGGSGAPHGLTGNSVKALAVDSAGNTLVTGTSQNPDFPTTPGAYQSDGHFGTFTAQIGSAFVARLSPAGQLVWSTWLGGNLVDCNLQGCQHYGPRTDAGTAIAVDRAGHVYVAGYTSSSDFPVTPGAFQTSSPQTCDFGRTVCTIASPFYNAFLTKLQPDGSGLVYSTFLGNLGSDSPPPPDGSNKALAVDGAGDVCVAFATSAAFHPFMATGGLQPARSGGSDVLLLVVNPSGSGLIASTYLGGSGDESVTAVALDSSGNIYLSGTTASPDFPDSWGAYPAGSDFVAELDPAAGRILFSARLPGGLAAQDIALASSAGGALVTAGSSGHILRFNPFGPASFPAVLGAGNAANGTIDSALGPNELVTIYGAGIGPAAPAIAQPLVLSGSLAAAVYPESLGGVQVSFNGQPAALLYVSANQINLGMPQRTAYPLVMTIVNNGVTLGPFAIAVSGVPVPGIFRGSDGAAAALNQDGTLNTPLNPAHAGSGITIWGSGVTEFANGGPDGGSIPAQVSDLTAADLVAVYGGSRGVFRMPVTYAGGAPGLIGGAFQINARVPAGLNGAVPVYLESSGMKSPPATIYVAP